MRKILEEIESLDKVIKEKVKPSIDNYFNNINLTQIKIVMYLCAHKNEEVCQKDFEDYLKIKKASITGALESMEEKGLIERIKCEDDARKKIVKLSKTIEEQHLKRIEALRDVENVLVKGLSEQDINKFFEILDVMRANADAINY